MVDRTTTGASAGPTLVVYGHKGSRYDIVEYGETYFGIHRDEGPFDIARIRGQRSYFPVFEAPTRREVEGLIEREVIGRDPPREVPPIAEDDFLLLAFENDRSNIAEALAIRLRERPGRYLLVGRPRTTRAYLPALEANGVEATAAPWSDGRAPQALPEGVAAVFCEVPTTQDDWARFRAWQDAYKDRLLSIWELTLPLAAIACAQNRFEYNSASFALMCDYYLGRAFHGRAAIGMLPQHLSFAGKRVIEFGPSDGLHTGALRSFGAKSILAVEARPENVIKLLIAKQAFGWDDVEVLAENFHAIHPDIHGRFDIAYAHGVYYHTNGPLMFLENLMRLSDTVLIGGWCATDEKPAGEWAIWDYGGHAYRGKVYAEPAHFLSGMQSESVYLEYASLTRFFEDRGYDCREISDDIRLEVTGRFVRFVARRR